MIKRIVILILFIVASVSMSADVFADNQNEQILISKNETGNIPTIANQSHSRRIEDNVFAVRYKDSAIGTAFLYSYTKGKDSYKFIITAAHTVEGLENETKHLSIRIPRHKGDIKIKGFKRAHPDTDVALIFLQDYNAMDSLPGLKSVKDNITFSYDQVYSFNYSSFPPEITNKLILSKGYVINDGIISDSFYSYLNIINRGGSGSPLFTFKSNELCGIITRQIIDEETNSYTGIAYAISSKALNNILGRYLAIYGMGNGVHQ